MLQPARRKYRKEQKGRNKGVATRGAKVSFGEFGLKATTRGRKRRTSSATSLPRVPTKRHSCPAAARQPATYSAPSGSAPSISFTTNRTLIPTRRY